MGNGRLEATEVQIAAKIPGRLAEVLVDEGDRVTQGQLLARMDTRTLEASRTQAEAEVLRARQTLAANEANVQLRQSEKLLASQELTRFRQLAKRGFASGQQLDQQQARFDTSNAAVVAAQAQVAAAKAAIGSSQAQVAQLTSEIDDSSLRAPINGVIQLRLAGLRIGEPQVGSQVHQRVTRRQVVVTRGVGVDCGVAQGVLIDAAGAEAEDIRRHDLADAPVIAAVTHWWT